MSAPFEIHVAHYRRHMVDAEDTRRGRLPADLSMPAPEDKRFSVSGSVADPYGMFRPVLGSLEFAGVTGDRICFEELRMLDHENDSEDPQLLAARGRELAVNIPWVMAVPSLTALAGPVWPIPAGGVALVPVAVRRDVVSSTEHVDGRTVFKTVDWATYTLCATGFQAPPAARYLIAFMHHIHQPDETEAPIPYDAKPGDERHDDALKQHDDMMVWTLSDDGSTDLSQ